VKSSALDANAASAERPKVGTTLDANSPLEAPGCLPTLPEVKCVEAEAPQPHHHPPAAVEAPGALVVDPVCKMKIDPTKAKGGSLELKGEQFFFCSTSCRTSFLKEHPEAK
jgi:YHS domain-containing protein